MLASLLEYGTISSRKGFWPTLATASCVTVQRGNSRRVSFSPLRAADTHLAALAGAMVLMLMPSSTLLVVLAAMVATLTSKDDDGLTFFEALGGELAPPVSAPPVLLVSLLIVLLLSDFLTGASMNLISFKVCAAMACCSL